MTVYVTLHWMLTLCNLPLHSSPYHSPGLSSMHLYGTHYLHSSPTDALWRPSNLGRNLLFFRLSFDCSVHVWPHHIPASASEVTLWKSVYHYYYYYYYVDQHFRAPNHNSEKRNLYPIPKLQVCSLSHNNSRGKKWLYVQPSLDPILI